MKPDRAIIKSQSHGRVGCDGNGMVGGDWMSVTHLAYKYVYLETIIKSDDAWEWMHGRLGDEAFRIDAYITTGYDHSVGQDYICEMDEWFTNDEFETALDECPYLTAEERLSARTELESIALNEDGYEFYDYEDA